MQAHATRDSAIPRHAPKEHIARQSCGLYRHGRQAVVVMSIILV